MATQNPQPGERLAPHHPMCKKILKKDKGFRVTQESVLLAGFSREYARGKILDLGTGSGIMLLLLSEVKKIRKLVGLDLNVSLLYMARSSAKLNNMDHRIGYVAGDIRNVPFLLRESSFDTVITNPPYYKHTMGRLSPDNDRASSRHEMLCSLDDVLHAASKVLVRKGRFIIIYLSERLPELFRKMETCKLTPKVMQLIHSYSEKPARHVMVCARKDAAPGLEILPPLIVYRNHKEYTTATKRYYTWGTNPENHVDTESEKD